jgi:hypothetical protein
MKTLKITILFLTLISFAAKYPGDKFAIAQLRFSGQWNTRPNAVKSLVIELMNRTSINGQLYPRVISLSSRDLFYYPFLLMTGKGYFPPFSKKERGQLRQYLEYGGFMFIDNASGIRGGPFDKCVRREIKALFPDRPLKALAIDHTVYRSFYLSRKTYFGGRVKSAPFLEGVTVEDVTPLIYSLNDATGAWEISEVGSFTYDVIPGGELQRKEAFKLGINLVLYALTANYKRDAVHVNTLLKRGRLRKVPWIK